MTALTSYSTDDVLYILDSCHASTVSLRRGPELLAAANWKSSAGAVLTTSFTKVLTDVLKQLDGKPCPVANIFGKIHREAMQSGIAEPPIHVAHPDKKSIILERFQKGPVSPRHSGRLTKLRIDALAESESRVLISVHVANNTVMPNIVAWKEWLSTTVPPSVNISQITIEGEFKAGSSVILVAMPVEIWTCLPANDKAYTFISYVNSSNLLLQQADASANPVANPLSLRNRPTGMENRPSGSQGHKRPKSLGGLGRGGDVYGFGGFDGGSET